MDDAGAEPEAVPNIAGHIITACGLGLCLFAVLVWNLGSLGDALVGIAVAGVLFRTPHTVAIWAALTLLALTVVALGANNSTLAESLANYVYYSVVLGCLWAIWNMMAERFHWNLPATYLFERGQRSMNLHSMPLPLLIAALTVAIVGAVALGPGHLLEFFFS